MSTSVGFADGNGVPRRTEKETATLSPSLAALVDASLDVSTEQPNAFNSVEERVREPLLWMAAWACVAKRLRNMSAVDVGDEHATEYVPPSLFVTVRYRPFPPACKENFIYKEIGRVKIQDEVRRVKKCV